MSQKQRDISALYFAIIRRKSDVNHQENVGTLLCCHEEIPALYCAIMHLGNIGTLVCYMYHQCNSIIIYYNRVLLSALYFLATRRILAL